MAGNGRGTSEETAALADKAGDIERQDDTVDDRDESTVTFLNGKSGGNEKDSKVLIGKEYHEKSCLTKDELAQFENDPFWKRLRLALFALFWVAWILMLLSAIIIILLAPRCPHRAKMSWWQQDVIYKVDVAAFLDSNEDGHGDLEGVFAKLDYFSQIGVKTLWLTPMFPTSHSFDRSDATDFMAIDERFGNVDQLRRLAKQMNKIGMHLIIDLVPNHSSKNHSWFQKSVKREGDFANYYVWQSGKENATGAPPNSWKNHKGESAWTYNEERKQFYLHQLDTDQPDLNYHDAKLKEEMAEIIRFWLAAGVDGIHISHPKYLVECPGFMEDHSTTFFNGTFRLLSEWRDIFDSVAEKTSRPRLLITDADGDLLKAVNYYGFDGKDGAHVVISQQLQQLNDKTTAMDISAWVTTWDRDVPHGRQKAWALGSGDTSRIATRMGSQRNTRVDLMNMMQMLLPGTPILYYGDEIGMEDITQSELTSAEKSSEWPFARSRSPMQWTGQSNAGFSKANTSMLYLPVHSNYPSINVETEFADGRGVSHLEFLAELTKLRNKESFLFGDIYTIATSDTVLAFVREAHGFEGFLVVINFGTGAETISFNRNNPNLVPAKATVQLTTPNLQASDLQKDHVVTTQIHLEAGRGVVLKWPGKEQKRLID